MVGVLGKIMNIGDINVLTAVSNLVFVKMVYIKRALFTVKATYIDSIFSLATALTGPFPKGMLTVSNIMAKQVILVRRVYIFSNNVFLYVNTSYLTTLG